MTQISAPYFYYRSYDHQFAILITQENFIRRLEAAISAGNKDAKELMNLVKKDSPLKQDTDLFRHVLSDPYLFSFVERMLVEPLAHGEVALIDAGTGEPVPRIEVKQYNSASGRDRRFYTPHRVEFFRSLDCVVN
jgi:hypothetical protein